MLFDSHPGLPQGSVPRWQRLCPKLPQRSPCTEHGLGSGPAKCSAQQWADLVGVVPPAISGREDEESGGCTKTRRALV